MTELQPPYDYSRGYKPVPQYPPEQRGYAPAPPVLLQQSNSNVVVVNQPSAPPQTIHVVHNRANDHMVLTLVMMVLCFLHGNLPAFVCLIPALCFAVVASDHNNAGDYERARKFGNAALGCNLCVFIYYVLLVLAAIAMVTVYFTVGFAWLTGTANTIAGDIAGVTIPPVDITIPPVDITIPPVTVPNCYYSNGQLYCY